MKMYANTGDAGSSILDLPRFLPRCGEIEQKI